MNKLTKKMVLMIALVMVLVAAVALPAQYFISKNAAESQAQLNASEVVSELEVILQEPVYVYDKALVQNIIELTHKRALSPLFRFSIKTVRR